MDHERKRQIDFSIICREPQELNVVIKKALDNTKTIEKEMLKKISGKIDFKCADRILDAITHSEFQLALNFDLGNL